MESSEQPKFKQLVLYKTVKPTLLLYRFYGSFGLLALL